ncbi:MAG: hypothetical protein IE909_06695 [Campylobacterales bacterium]|nr:hypothetical protein [Campylobacterales bacterium]
MTKTQTKFYNIIKNQIIDFEELFHKEFTLDRIQKIDENRLKFLLEDINTDKDNFSKKGYITYAKFCYYADKYIEQQIDQTLLLQNDFITNLIAKRDLVIKTLDESSKSFEHKRNLIEQIKNKQLMFKHNGKNIFTEHEYAIIEQFGFEQFFDENDNYAIHLRLSNHCKNLLQNSSSKTKLLSQH